MRTLLIASAAPVAYAAQANPIRRVVTLLEDMKKEVEAEGAKEAELYKKFQCYCKDNDGNLSADAEAAQTAINSNNAAAEEKNSLKKQTEEELVQAKKDRKEATETLAEATALRKKEKLAFDQASGDHKGYLDATKKAVTALEKGRSGAFLQTNTAGMLKNLLASGAIETIDASDRETVMSFLTKDYVPQGGEIIGILKNMIDEFEKTLGGLVQAEADSVKNFNALAKAKKSEIGAATRAIESKTELKGKLAVEIAQHTAAAEAAAKELSDSEAFLANLKQTCADKAADWAHRSSERSGELESITMAITTLNDDDALDIFKKSLPSAKPAAFLQRGSAKASPVARVAALLKSKNLMSNPVVSLIAHTAVSKLKAGVDFRKIIVMIDEMVTLLKQEQIDEEASLEQCSNNLSSSEAEKKETENTIESLEAQMGELEASIKADKETVAKKNAEVASLDKATTEATEQRADEKKAFEDMVALNTSAIQLIEKAKNQLNKFYNPHMYKAPEERELTEEERILQGAGQDIGDTTATTAIGGTTQTTTVFSQGKAMPPPAPATYGEFKSKSGKSNSVIALLDRLVGELESEIQSAEHDEKTAIRDYENMMADSKKNRADAVQSIADTETAIAQKEEDLGSASSSHDDNTQKLGEVKKQIADLHAQCDFVIANFDARKDARTTEMEGLVTAKSILKGANYE